ncbi:AAA family ATPase [Streptomyces sp. NPDC006512]|uniref:AAA family ATPase n=1 Tax=Streptomyces sp. NPDC006512 TaxID=3154307 RepID=UPI0033A8810D
MKRILVTGISGAGKTTMARALAARLGLPFHEMDTLRYAGPGWAPNPGLHEELAAIAAGPRWVLDSVGPAGGRDPLWTRADTVVWLDYPRSVVMPRVLRRSVRRTLTRERIFGGNVESLADWFTADHPVRWAWSRHAARRAEIDGLTRDPRFAPLRTLRFRAPRQADRWLRTL